MDIVAVIANLGFPIALSVYLLTRLEKKMDDIENSVTGKDGVLDKLDDVKKEVALTRKATKANYVGKVKGEKYV